MSRLRSWWASPWAGLMFVVVVAALLRYPGLDQVPPGLNFDEGGEGVAALDVASGIYRIWWPIGGGKEPLMAYLVQPFFWLLGPTRLALRLYTASMGVIAVAGAYWLAWEMLAKTREGWSETNLRPFLPLFAALGLATAFWHVAYSRIAFRALAMPAVEVLGLAWLWRALRSSETPERSAGRWGHFVGAGALIGLGAYTYLPGRFVPMALALFFVAEALLARLHSKCPLLVRYFPGLALSTVMALLVFVPLAVFFAQHPQAFVERAGAVSVFNPTWNQGDLWGTLLRTSLTTLGTFAALSGDPNPLGNLPGRPMLGLILAPFFWLGVAISVGLIVRRAGRGLKQVPMSATWPAGSYLFLLCWWSVMLLPGILAPEDAPHHLRIIGAAPAVYILVAVGVSEIADRIFHISNRRSQMMEQASGTYTSLQRRIVVPMSRLGAWLPVLAFLVIGMATARDYFVRWVRLPELYMAYDVYAVELADQMAAETNPSVVYAIPMDLRAGHEARHYTLDFLYQGNAPYRYLPVDEATIAAQLTDAVAGYRILRVVRWLQDKHAAADEREMVTFLLTRAARLSEETTYPVYRVETWELPSTSTLFTLPAINQNVGVTFGNALRLEAADVSVAGGMVGVALRWAPLAAMGTDYKASLRLMTADGSIAAQKDRFLRHNWHQGTSLWPPETVNEYYVLPPVPPGEYNLCVVVYHPETLAPLPTEAGAEASVGKVRLE